MPSKKLVIILIILVSFASFGALFTIWLTVGFPAPYEKVLLNRFPVSLDELFRMDRPAEHDSIVDQIRLGREEAGQSFIDAYPDYFHYWHFPATFKCYVNVGRHSPISLPIDSYLQVDRISNASTKLINGCEVVVDVRLLLHVSYYIKIELEHVLVNSSIIERYNQVFLNNVFGQLKKAVLIPADTVFAFSPTPWSFDFRIIDYAHYNFPTESGFYLWQHSANPFFYFTESLQNEFLSYYDAQYNAMKESGLYPTARLNHTFSINEPHSLFGAWFYLNGPLVLNSTHHSGDRWYNFDSAFLDILNVNVSDRETFYKDFNTGLNFSTDMIGVYCDGDYEDVAGYDLVGGRYMYLLDGDFQAGIVNLTEFFNNIRTGQIYMKYQFLEMTASSMMDDLLYVEYFDDFGAAQGNFTANRFTYTRYYTHNH
jgi:hypothetical protein